MQFTKYKFKDICLDKGFVRGPFGSALKNPCLFLKVKIHTKFMSSVYHSNKIKMAVIIIFLGTTSESRLVDLK